MRSTLVALSLVCLSAAVYAQETEPSGTDHKRVYLMGNSLTHNLRFGEFEATVKADGRGLTLGRHTCAGIYLDWFWENPNTGFTVGPYGYWGKAWRDYEWDAVSLQPYWRSYNRSMKHAKLLVSELYKKSPDAQVYIYVQWPRVAGGNYYHDWRAPYDPEKSAQYCRAFYEDYRKELGEAFPDRKPVKLIPVGYVLALLDQKIRAGQVPGLESVFDCYMDNQHMNVYGSYVVGATFYATLYGRDPRQVPMRAYQARYQTDMTVSDKLAKVLNETVWQVVASNPFTGVTSDDPLEVLTPGLVPAVAGEAYRAEIQYAYGRPPYAWSLVGGNLPDGLSLGEDGVISGTAGAPGVSVLAVEVKDAIGSIARRELRLDVEDDTAPKIVTKELPEMSCGERIDIPLKAANGNAPLVWHSILGPAQGAIVQSDGRLVGTAGKPGKYRLKVVVQDGDSQKPEKDVMEFTQVINPPKPDVLVVKMFDHKKIPMTMDGKLDEPIWRLDQSIEKVVKGKDYDNKAVFGARWRSYRFYLAVRVMDDDIQTGDEDPEKNDSVEIFIDTLNNREKQYNADDHRYVIDAGGKVKKFGVAKQTQTKTTRIDGGYIVEFEFSGHDAAGMAIKKAWSTMGLDVAVNDVDQDEETSRSVWKGNADNATVPDSFGTVVFDPAQTE